MAYEDSFRIKIFLTQNHRSTLDTHYRWIVDIVHRNIHDQNDSKFATFD